MHSFEDESHENASTKECTLVSIRILTLDDIDLAKKVKFSQISQRQDACDMALLKMNSLCCFRNLYSCLKVNSFSKILGKSPVSLWITSGYPFNTFSRSLIVHKRYRIGTNLVLLFSLPMYLWSFFSGVVAGYAGSLHKFTQPFNFVFTKIVAWALWNFVVQNDAQIKFFGKTLHNLNSFIRTPR